ASRFLPPSPPASERSEKPPARSATSQATSKWSEASSATATVSPNSGSRNRRNQPPSFGPGAGGGDREPNHPHPLRRSVPRRRSPPRPPWPRRSPPLGDAQERQPQISDRLHHHRTRRHGYSARASTDRGGTECATVTPSTPSFGVSANRPSSTPVCAAARCGSGRR